MIICTNEKCDLKDTCRRSAENNKDVIGGIYKTLDGEECFRKIEDAKDRTE